MRGNESTLAVHMATDIRIYRKEKKKTIVSLIIFLADVGFF